MEILVLISAIIIGCFLLIQALKLLAYLVAAVAIGYVVVAGAVGYVIALVTGIPAEWTIGIAMALGLGVGIRDMAE